MPLKTPIHERRWAASVLFRMLLALASLTAHPPSTLARTAKGDMLIRKARIEEAKDTTAALDTALALATQALETDRLDISYQVEAARTRAFAAQYHVYDGQVLRDKKQLAEALKEFEKAAALDPASEVAPQEIERTKALMLELKNNPDLNIDEALMRPLPRKNKADESRFAKSLPLAQLKVELTAPLPAIKVNNQSSAELFLALSKKAGLRVLFDPEYQARSLGPNQFLDLQGLSIERALDYVALVTRSFWKPLASDTIFVANDDATRRSVYEDQITKAFYLTNAPVTQEVNDIAQTIQRVTDIKKLFVHPEQNVIVARSDPDRMALAEKIVADLDKPKAEIIVDVVILAVTSTWTRDLGVALNINASNTNVAFAPRQSIGGATDSNGRVSIPLSSLAKLAGGDFNITLPGAALNALLSINGTKVVDKAQLRTVEGQKSTIRIGTKVPYATGSFSTGAFASSTGALVNTQFQFFDVGLNIDVTAKVHEPDEVSLHIESDQSAVLDRVNIGGVEQPILSQRKRMADVRVKEGEVNFWDIVTERQDVKVTSGLPPLAQIPVVGRLFSSTHLEKSEYQILTLLVPHIIRAPDIRNVNLLGIPSGTEQIVRLRYKGSDDGALPRNANAPVLELTPTPGLAVSAAPVTAPAVTPPGAPPSSATPQAGQPGVPALAVGQPRLYFSPTRQQGAAKSPVSVDLMLGDAPDVAEGVILAQFDNRYVRLVSALPGSMVSEITAPPGGKMEDGLLMVKIARKGSGSPAEKLATLQFEGVSPGACPLASAPSRLVNSAGKDITVRTDAGEITIQP